MIAARTQHQIVKRGNHRDVTKSTQPARRTHAVRSARCPLRPSIMFNDKRTVMPANRERRSRQLWSVRGDDRASAPAASKPRNIAPFRPPSTRPPTVTSQIADGTYTGTGNRDINLMGKATIRHRPATTVIDIQGNHETSTGFVMNSGETQATVIRNLCHAWIDVQRPGHALSNAGPTVCNVTMKDNHADCWGGGVLRVSGWAKLNFHNCRFSTITPPTTAVRCSGSPAIRNSRMRLCAT
jgi:hypothetical protein